MPESLQSYNINIHHNMREWVKEQVAKTYSTTEKDLEHIKTSIANKSLEKELTMINVLNVLKKAYESMKNKPFRDVYQEMSAGLVLSIQIALQKLGYAPGSIDGVYKNAVSKTKSNTQIAVEHFQSKNGLLVDGVVGPLTLGKLISSLNSSLGPSVHHIPIFSRSKHSNAEQKKTVEVKKNKKTVVETKKKPVIIERKKDSVVAENKGVETSKKDSVVIEKPSVIIEEKKDSVVVESKGVEISKKDSVVIEKPSVIIEEKKDSVVVENKGVILEEKKDWEKLETLLSTYLVEKNANYYKKYMKIAIDSGLLDAKSVQTQLQVIVDEGASKNISKNEIEGRLLLKIYFLTKDLPETIKNQSKLLLQELGTIRSKYYDPKKNINKEMLDPQDISRVSILTQKISLLADAYEQLPKDALPKNN